MDRFLSARRVACAASQTAWHRHGAQDGPSGSLCDTARTDGCAARTSPIVPADWRREFRSDAVAVGLCDEPTLFRGHHDPIDCSPFALFLMSTAMSVWRWATGLADRPVVAGPLPRRQFERRARQLLATAGGRPGALVYIRLEGMSEAEGIIGRQDCECIAQRLSALITTIAADSPAMRFARDAFLVYVQDMQFSVDVAEAVRVAARTEFTPDRLRVLASKDLLRPTPALDMRLLTITAGICAFSLQHDFVDAVRRAEDALLRARQAVDTQALSNCATSNEWDAERISIDGHLRQIP
jgi:hypothetical protein